MAIEVGSIMEGTVAGITNFGAFLELLPGREGMCHISQLDRKRVEKVEDVVNVGDKLKVRVMEIDERGKIDVSHSALFSPDSNGSNNSGGKFNSGRSNAKPESRSNRPDNRTPKGNHQNSHGLDSLSKFKNKDSGNRRKQDR